MSQADIVTLSDFRRATAPPATSMREPGAEACEFGETAARVADVLMAVEGTLAIDFNLLAYVDVTDGLGWVAVRMSGGKWRLTPDEAEQVADALRAERAFLGCNQVASAFDRAAGEATRIEGEHRGQTLTEPVVVPIPRKPLVLERLFGWTDRFTPGQRTVAAILLALVFGFAGGRVG